MIKKKEAKIDEIGEGRESVERWELLPLSNQFIVEDHLGLLKRNKNELEIGLKFGEDLVCLTYIKLLLM